jgi:hypothetical protein
MHRATWILALSLGCATPNGLRNADKPLTMALDDTTTLQVGEVVVLHIPSDTGFMGEVPPRPYQNSVNGGWFDVLALVKQSGRDVTFRAVHPGRGVIIISPDAREGECISCATLHYFYLVKVASKE